MELLASLGIDYYTRWEHVKGKGHGTDAHLGTPSFPAVNSMLLIAFQEEAPLEKLIVEIASLSAGATRPDARIRRERLRKTSLARRCGDEMAHTCRVQAECQLAVSLNTD
jgi:hypothetical protein